MSEVERTSAGLQIVMPGCERRTLPKSTTRVDESGQGLLHFYKPPTLREKLESRAEAPLRSTKGQKALPKSGLFSTIGFAKPRECSAT
jgi:hypothetical protein